MTSSPLYFGSAKSVVFRRHAVPLRRIVDAGLVAPDQRHAVGLAVLDQPGGVLERREQPGGVGDAGHVERREELRAGAEDGALEVLVGREQVDGAAAARVEAGQRLVARDLELRLELDLVVLEELLGDIGAVLAVPAEIVERTAELGGARPRRHAESREGGEAACALEEAAAARRRVELRVKQASDCVVCRYLPRCGTCAARPRGRTDAAVEIRRCDCARMAGTASGTVRRMRRR